MNERANGSSSWWHDDLLAWVCPGGLLLTALALRYPAALQALRAQAPELTLPTWLAGAYVLGLALSPLGRPIYAVLPGWRTDISGVSTVEGLPEPARAFIELVEKEVGVPVRIVGTGAARDSYVTWS